MTKLLALATLEARHRGYNKIGLNTYPANFPEMYTPGFCLGFSFFVESLKNVLHIRLPTLWYHLQMSRVMLVLSSVRRASCVRALLLII